MGSKRTRLPALSTLDSIKEALDVRLGRRGDKLDAAVTFRDLEESGAFEINLPGGGAGGGTSVRDLRSDPKLPAWMGRGVNLDTWVPSAPGGFTATALMGGIFIEWDWPAKYGAIGYTEVYRGTTNSAGDRVFLTTESGLTYMDLIDGADEQEYFYWIRFVSLGDKVGPYAGPVSAVSVPSSEYLIDRMVGKIDESLLAQHLSARVDLIDGGTSATDGGLVQTVEEQGALITQVQTQLDDDYAALQQQLSTEYNEVSGRIESMYSVRINSNGRISGFGLADDGTESVFGVEADRFYVSGSGSGDRPFIVSGGRTYIRDAVIQDGAIDNAKIGTGAITNAKIANASIDDAKISSAGIDFAKIKNVEIADAMIGSLHADKITGDINVAEAVHDSAYMSIGTGSHYLGRESWYLGYSRGYHPFFTAVFKFSSDEATNVEVSVTLSSNRMSATRVFGGAIFGDNCGVPVAISLAGVNHGGNVSVTAYARKTMAAGSVTYRGVEGIGIGIS